MKNLGIFTSWIVLLVAACLVSLLTTKVFLSVATLFGLTSITQFTFLQVYGFISLFGLISVRPNKSESEQTLTEALTLIVSRVLQILAFWGLSFIMYSVLS